MFSANYLATNRYNGPGTRSVFDSGHGEALYGFASIEEAFAAALAAQAEAVELNGYEPGWIMVEDEDSREVVLDATADQVEAVRLGIQNVAGLLAFRAAQEARWAAEADERRAALAAIATDEIPF